METLQKDPTFVASMSSAKEMYEDPSKAQRIMQQIKDDAVAAGVSGDSLQPVRFIRPIQVIWKLMFLTISTGEVI